MAEGGYTWTAYSDHGPALPSDGQLDHRPEVTGPVLQQFPGVEVAGIPGGLPGQLELDGQGGDAGPRTALRSMVAY